jgi:dTDP-4-dehydrorhamnose reductase
MKILVTGSQGQLVQSLIERGAGFPGLSLRAAGRPDLDLEDPASIERVVRAEAPDVIVNAAAYTKVDQAEDEPDRAFRINAAAAGELAAAARKAGARLIQISTDYVFDGDADVPYTEEARTNPLGVYGRSKLEGEELVRSETPDHLIVRTAWVYSPFGQNFVKTMMRLGRDRDSLSVVADQHGNPSSALDLADGLLTAISVWRQDSRRGLGETFHLAGSGPATWFEFAEHILAECKRLGISSATVCPISTEDWPTKAARPRNSMLDCAKFVRSFDFRAPDWRQSASETIKRLT